MIRINKKEISDEEILELAINAGAEECISTEDIHEIFCNKEELYKVKKIIEKKILNFIFTGIEWIPLNKVDIIKDKIEVIENFFEALEDDDDVQNFFTNIKGLNITQ